MGFRYKRFQAKRFSRKRLLISNFISQMTVFWRRELIDQVGLLDESLPLAFDYDYCLRLAVNFRSSLHRCSASGVSMVYNQQERR